MTTDTSTNTLSFKDAGDLFGDVGQITKDFTDEYGAVTSEQAVDYTQIVSFSRTLYDAVSGFLEDSGAVVELDGAEIGDFMRKTTIAMDQFLLLDTDGNGGNGERSKEERLSELNDELFGAAIDLVGDAGDVEESASGSTASQTASRTASLTDSLNNSSLTRTPGSATQFANTGEGLNQAMGSVADALLGQLG